MAASPLLAWGSAHSTSKDMGTGSQDGLRAPPQLIQGKCTERSKPFYFYSDLGYLMTKQQNTKSQVFISQVRKEEWEYKLNQEVGEKGTPPLSE